MWFVLSCLDPATKKMNMKKNKILLYGANGFTACLMIKDLKALPIELIVAGRNHEKIQDLAQQYGLSFRSFNLIHQKEIVHNLADIDLLINCAGPFSETALPLAKAALKIGCHYFDITGEINVFKNLYELNDQAEKASCALIPGLGFDIAPSDCLAKLVADKTSDPERLILAVIPKTRPTHGTLKTALLGLGHHPRARRKGGITLIGPSEPKENIRVHGRTIPCVRAPLPDLFCAYLSTGIENIDTYLSVSPKLQKLSKIMPLLNILKKFSLSRQLMNTMIEWLPNGPSESVQKNGHAFLYAKVVGRDGASISGLMTTKEPYSYTADLIINATTIWLEKGLVGGFFTPSQAFGAHFAQESCPDQVFIEYSNS